jgi:hypothetical protein
MSNASEWELTVAENGGEVLASTVDGILEIPVQQLLTDAKAQMMLMPKNLTYTIGWKAIVWKKKEGGRFQELTDAEFKQFSETGTAQYSRGNPSDGGEVEHSTGSEGTP